MCLRVLQTKTVITFILLCLQLVCSSQSPLKNNQKKRFFIGGLPLLFYTPETRWGGGASVVTLFNFRSDTINAPRSSVNLGIAVTQNKQVLFSIPYQLYIGNNGYRAYGEIT